MILRGARVALGPASARNIDITIRGSRIAKLGDSRARDAMDLSGHLILPGLINAHDHLSFNLFPLLGSPPYPNATAWARDVYHPDESPVREHRQIPRAARLAWGAIRNLIGGVTTVAHHDPDPPRMFGARFPVNVVQQSVWIHSLQFTPDLAPRIRNAPRDWPVILHLGEGTDAGSAQELFDLDRRHLLDQRTVVVHGVAIDARGFALLRKRGASLIACPVSNLFTLSRTLKRSVFDQKVPIALGTDSAITATGDLLDHLRAARAIWNLSAAKLYRMVTETPARMLHLNEGQGAIRENGIADLIVMRDPLNTPAKSLLDLRHLEMVIVRGKIRLVSDRLKRFAPSTFESIAVEGRGRVWIGAPVADLYRAATSVLGKEWKLAGKRVRINNPK